MKTSRIIFISYFSFIGLFLLSLAVMGFVYKDKGKLNARDIESAKIDLDPFTHLYIEANCNVRIDESTKDFLKYSTQKGKESLKPIHEVRNDTLFIRSTRINEHNRWVTLNAKDIRTVDGTQCEITITHLNQESLSINLFKSRLRFQDKVNLASLDLNLKGRSDFGGYNFKVKGVNLKIKSSTARFNSRLKVDTLQGTVTDKSEIRLPKAKHLQLDVDESSKMKMY